MDRILVLDNYDSFVHNLVHYLEMHDVEVDLFRNDRISAKEALAYERILLSPGPGLPKDAGIMPELVRGLGPEHQVLGVCLGHQALAEGFGGTLKNLERVIHGESTIARRVKECPLFDGAPEAFEIGHYHSWVVDEVPGSFDVTVRDEDDAIMAIAHKERSYFGVQFHPESVLTPEGPSLVRNWLGSV